MVTPYFIFGYHWYLYKDLLSTDSFKPYKNITVFVSITNRKTQVSRDAQNICAVTVVSTALKLLFACLLALFPSLPYLVLLHNPNTGLLSDMLMCWCLGGGQWLSCHGDLFASEESTSSPNATFKKPSLQ